MAVEYQDHTSNQIYVSFNLKTEFRGHKNLGIVIWTTTPGQFRVIVGISYNSDLDYEFYQNKEKEKFVIAKDLIDNFTDVTQLHLELIDTFNGKELEKLVAIHPFIELGYDYDVPLLNADFVTTEQGTG